MALTLLLTVTGGSINGAESIAKSFPDFFKTISQIGIDLNETN
jgi:3-phosphoshikimate 1-carboxyvinyltransferase